MTQCLAVGGILLTSQLCKEHPLRAQLEGVECVLLVQRSFRVGRFPGAWTVPTGIARDSEDFRAVAVREMMEELNVEFVPEKEPVYMGHNHPFTILYFTGWWRPTLEVPSLQPVTTRHIENVGLGFFPVDEAIQMGEKSEFSYAKALRELKNKSAEA